MKCWIHGVECEDADDTGGCEVAFGICRHTGEPAHFVPGDFEQGGRYHKVIQRITGDCMNKDDLVVCQLCGRVRSKKVRVIDDEGQRLVACEEHFIRDGKRVALEEQLEIIRQMRLT